jgi:integrase
MLHLIKRDFAARAVVEFRRPRGLMRRDRLCVLLSTGARSGEVKALRWSQPNLDGGMLTIGRAKTKKGTGRQIPLNTDMVTILTDHAAWYSRKLGEIRSEWHVLSGPLGEDQERQAATA